MARGAGANAETAPSVVKSTADFIFFIWGGEEIGDSLLLVALARDIELAERFCGLRRDDSLTA